MKKREHLLKTYNSWNIIRYTIFGFCANLSGAGKELIKLTNRSNRIIL